MSVEKIEEMKPDYEFFFWSLAWRIGLVRFGAKYHGNAEEIMKVLDECMDIVHNVENFPRYKVTIGD
jgi:hypothetical protein